MASEIKGIAFDWGGVLIENPAQAIADRILEYTGLSSEFMKEIPSDLFIKFQKGKISESGFWERVESSLSITIPQKGGLWLKAFQASYIPKCKMFDLVKAMQGQGLKTAILSNTEMPAVNFFHEQGYTQFDIEIFSCVVGMAKPDLDIYEATIDAFGLESQEIVFIDDKPENIEAAHAVGMLGIVFETEEQVRSDLRDLGLKA